MTARQALLATATEAEVAAYVAGAAVLGGWLAYHTHDSRRSPEGYPDWTLVHHRRRLTVFAELKGYTTRGRLGQLTLEQHTWLVALRAAGQFAYLWVPQDRDLIDDVLLRGQVGDLPPLPDPPLKGRR